MLESKKIAVTGGLACGKSSVCRFLEEFGAEVVDADRIVHHLIETDREIGKQLIEILGIEGEISRQTIAEKVFSNPEKLQQLEGLLHPAVHREINSRFQESKAPLFVAEVPLLFESETHEDYDAVVVVVAEREESQKRFTGTAFEERLARQLPLQEKVAKADYIIKNSGSVAELKQQVKELYERLIG